MKAFLYFILSISVITSTACSESSRKLDQEIFYSGPEFKLKLVRYYENLPLHYTGEVFRVQCSSLKTSHLPGHAKQDPGWRTLGNGSAIGSKSAKHLASLESKNYLVLSDRILAWKGNGISISFDACGSFRSWYPSSLPAAMVIPAKKPPYCKPTGSADCSNLDFVGVRAPKFENVEVSSSGHITFVLRSEALKQKDGVKIRSTDFGKTWVVNEAT